MNNTKELEIQRGENEIVDYIMDNWNSNETEVKINYLRLLRVSGRIGRKYTLRTKLKKSGERF
jgi:hypothetical protein